MTLSTFRTLLAAYMQRDETTFTIGGINLLTQAINMARKWAERQHNFEMNRCSGRIAAVHYTDGALLSTMELWPATNPVTSISPKNIERAYLGFSDGSGEFPVDLMSRDQHVERLKRHYEQTVSTDPRKTVPASMVSFFSVVRHAEKVYITPPDTTALGGTTVAVYFDVVRWMVDYDVTVTDANSASTDFLMTYCPDFLMFKTIEILNFFLKEDQRIKISDEQVEKAWNSVVNWDSSVILNASNDANLD